MIVCVYRDTGVAVTAAGLYATHCGEGPSQKWKYSFNGPPEKLHVCCLLAIGLECYLLLVLRVWLFPLYDADRNIPGALIDAQR